MSPTPPGFVQNLVTFRLEAEPRFGRDVKQKDYLTWQPMSLMISGQIMPKFTKLLRPKYLGTLRSPPVPHLSAFSSHLQQSSFLVPDVTSDEWRDPTDPTILGNCQNEWSCFNSMGARRETKGKLEFSLVMPLMFPQRSCQKTLLDWKLWDRRIGKLGVSTVNTHWPVKQI